MCEVFIAPPTNSLDIVSIESMDGISFLRILDLKYEEPRFACLISHSITNKNVIKTINRLNSELTFTARDMESFVSSLDVISKTSSLSKVPVIRVNSVFIAIGLTVDSTNSKTIFLEFFKSKQDLDKCKNAYTLQITESMLKKFVCEMEKLLYKTR